MTAAASELPDLDERPGVACFVFGPGTGESIAVRISDGEQVAWMVVDSCVVEPGAANPAVELIDYYGDELSMFVVTHRHADHVLGAQHLVDMLGLNRDPGRLVVADSFVDTTMAIKRGTDAKTEAVVRGIHQALLALDDAPSRGIPTIIAHRGMTDDLSLLDARIEVMHPPEPATDPVPPATANDWSIVIRLEWRGHVLLLTGDATRKSFQDLDSDELWNHESCKVPHHGSAGSIHPSWTGTRGEADAGRTWTVTPYSSCALPRLDEHPEPPSDLLTDHVRELRLTSLPVSDSFRLTLPEDLTVEQYRSAVAGRKAGLADLRAASTSPRHWSDATWWFQLDEHGAMTSGRGPATVLVTSGCVQDPS